MLFEAKEKFKLSNKFVEKFKDKQPEWGPIGYITYKRSYAREIVNYGSKDYDYPKFAKTHTDWQDLIKDKKANVRTEEYWETVKRVVEGCYTVQQNHCKSLKLPWNAHKAQRSAQEMFTLMWKFKFLPPGRGLWAMGSDVVWERGSSSLCNCAFISTNQLDTSFSEPFTFLMDMSLTGVGVAFDTLGAGKVNIKKPKKCDYTHVIPDSREGWVEIVELILDAYVGNAVLPKDINYSEIRPEGTPIITFGGIAPGPDPLIKCVSELIYVLDKYVGKPVDSALIVDIFNILGKAVVSGGIRRVAELALGSANDEDYMKLKDPDLYSKEMKDWRWASNNSVNCDVGMDYTEVAKQTAINGEPGYFWLENAQKYGRLIDGVNWDDGLAMGTNPCIVGDTKVAVADGRTGVTIKDLVDNDEDNVPVYCSDDCSNLVVKNMVHPRITGYNKQIYKVTLDNGESVRVTENHKFKMKDKRYKKVCDLQPGDSLNLLHRYIPDGRSESRADQYQTFSYDGVTYTEHTMVYEHRHGKIPKGYHVNHLDHNKLNNNIGNLECLSEHDHLSKHSKMENNPRWMGVSDEKMVEEGVLLCKRLGRRFSGDEWVEYAKDHKLPMQISRDRSKTLGNYLEFASKCATMCGMDKDLIKLDTRVVRSYMKLLDDGFDAFIDDGEIYVRKICEVCGSKFTRLMASREVSVCSPRCVNKSRSTEERKRTVETLNATHKALKVDKRKQQVEVYSNLKFMLGRDPQKKEWISACKEKGYKFRLGPISPFRDYNSLKEYASEYNHKVVSVEEDGFEDVYNGTVDEFHNFFIGEFSEKTPKGRSKYCYINNLQCGEQSLQNAEICNLVETFPSRHESYAEFSRTLKFAYLYAKSVTLIPTHRERTNQIILKNRRIGISQSGIVEALEKFGRREYISMCDKAYNYIKALDKEYSGWLCIPKSIKLATVKPSGTISLLPGVTPGIHFPHSKYYIRRIELTATSPLVKLCQEAGYKTPKSVYKDNTVVAEFPVESQNFARSKDDVSMWEQLEMAAAMQTYWSDNQVSITVTFNKDEAKDIANALELFEDRLKAVSFLPLSDHGYDQAPYEEIDEKTFKKLKSKTKPFKFGGNLDTHDVLAEEKFCDGDNCSIIKS